MNKLQYLQIIGLAAAIFTEAEYEEFQHYVEKEYFTSARIFVEEKQELLEIIFMSDSDNEVLRNQIDKCNELNNIMTDIYLEVMI